MSDLCGLFFPPVFSLFIENPPPPAHPISCALHLFCYPLPPPVYEEGRESKF